MDPPIDSLNQAIDTRNPFSCQGKKEENWEGLAAREKTGRWRLFKKFQMQGRQGMPPRRRGSM